MNCYSFIEEISKVLPINYESPVVSRSDISTKGLELVNKCSIAWGYDLLDKTFDFTMRTLDNKVYVGQGKTAKEAFNNRRLK